MAAAPAERVLRDRFYLLKEIGVRRAERLCC
jgi:hypothetical protein